jgi:hypothetical protein
MKNETKLTPADLAIYLGAQCEVAYTPGGFEYYDNGGIYLISGGLINEYGKGAAAVKPILRPLSDMTEPEGIEVQYMVDQMGVGYNATHGAQITRYLLSRHFDLFGWIEAGLAIDKTKTDTP